MAASVSVGVTSAAPAGTATPLAAAAAATMPASERSRPDGGTIDLCATLTSQSSSTECSIETLVPLRAACRRRCAPLVPQY